MGLLQRVKTLEKRMASENDGLEWHTRPLNFRHAGMRRSHILVRFINALDGLIRDPRATSEQRADWREEMRLTEPALIFELESDRGSGNELPDLTSMRRLGLLSEFREEV